MHKGARRGCDVFFVVWRGAGGEGGGVYMCVGEHLVGGEVHLVVGAMRWCTCGYRDAGGGRPGSEGMQVE